MSNAEVFGQVDDPALAERVVHFVGRRRGQVELPSGVPLLASERLDSILTSGRLRGFAVPWSSGRPVVCASDLSAAELEASFAAGLNARGGLEPWALVLRRQSVWLAGMRPVIYVEQAAADHFSAAAAQLYGAGWESLVVPTNPLAMHHEDWTHEREWRRCFDPDDHDDAPWIGISAYVRAIVVGERGWTPSTPDAPFAGQMRTVERWWWSSEDRRLIKDGTLEVRPN